MQFQRNTKTRIKTNTGLKTICYVFTWLCLLGLSQFSQANSPNNTGQFTQLASPKEVTIIIDTSGSMERNDPQRYAVQISKILSDLLGNSDQLDIIRMPENRVFFQGPCSDPPTPSNHRNISLMNRIRGKNDIDQLIRYTSNATVFVAPIRTAIQQMATSQAKQLLLFVADSGGFSGECGSTSLHELNKIMTPNVTLAAINIGSGRNAFKNIPAFHFSETAADAMGLITSVGSIYQQFLGTQSIQTGSLNQQIEIDVAALVPEAYLVIAADGPIADIKSANTNPSAAHIDLNLHQGGSTIGLDNKRRDYKIIKLTDPEAGRWLFNVNKNTQTAGWLLIQNSALGLAMETRPSLIINKPGIIELKLIDVRNGSRVTDPNVIASAKISAEVEGKTIHFYDNGIDGDKKAADGIFTASAKYTSLGDKSFKATLSSPPITKEQEFHAKVIDTTWDLKILTNSEAQLQDDLILQVHLVPVKNNRPTQVPSSITATISNSNYALLDNGVHPDAVRGDDIYTGRWRTDQLGEIAIQYQADAKNEIPERSQNVTVYGKFNFGPANPLVLGKLEPSSEKLDTLNLAGTESTGPHNLDLQFEPGISGLGAEIQINGHWQPLNNASLKIEPNGSLTWPVRVTTSPCLGAVDNSEKLILHLSNAKTGDVLQVPIQLQTRAATWLECWWWLVALIITTILLCIVIYGIISPHRFSSMATIIISPEEDMGEGFPHAIKAIKGSRSGFYRDAQIYIDQNHQLKKQRKGSVAKLRADRFGIKIKPLSGYTILRQNFEGGWEELNAVEHQFHAGTLYKVDSKDLFFELRNRAI